MDSTSSSSTSPPSPTISPSLELIRTTFRPIHNYPRPGSVTYALEDVLVSPSAFHAVLETFRDRYRSFVYQPITHIVASEARGFLIGPTLAYLLGIPFVPVRRSQKLPYDEILKTTVRSHNHFSTGNTLEMQKGILYATLPQTSGSTTVQYHPTVLIIDDVIGSGATVEAIVTLVKENGGNIYEVCAIASIPGQKGHETLHKLGIRTYTILP